MPHVAVLDACVLHSFWPRDILLRLAERGLFRPVWSRAILNEMTRSLVDRGYETPLARLLGIAFPDALVTPSIGAFAAVPAEVDPGDHHVVAAAIVSHASIIVTVNLRHFPASVLAPLQISVRSPDAFLLELLRISPQTVIETLEEEVSAFRNPPAVDIDALLELASEHAPTFVRAIRSLMR